MAGMSFETVSRAQKSLHKTAMLPVTQDDSGGAAITYMFALQFGNANDFLDRLQFISISIFQNRDYYFITKYCIIRHINSYIFFIRTFCFRYLFSYLSFVKEVPSVRACIPFDQAAKQSRIKETTLCQCPSSHHSRRSYVFRSIHRILLQVL